MRLNVVLITIVVGGLIGGAVFFVFGYSLNIESTGSSAISVGKTEAQRAFLLPVSQTNYLPVRDFNIPEPELEARAAVLFDISSGKFLFAENMNRRLPIASITKLMTAVVVLENLDLSRTFTVSAENVNVDGNGADLYRGEQIKGGNLFKIMLIKSSNDAALVFAAQAQKEGIDLIAKMNEKAQQIGMFNTKFSDPAGLDDYGAFSTAADLVKLVRYSEKHELISETLREKSADVYSVDGQIAHHLINTNQLLGQISGIFLGKTGYTDRALGTMVLDVHIGSGQDRVISIILGSDDRFGETKKLIDWAPKAYSWK